MKEETCENENIDNKLKEKSRIISSSSKF
jgi:hypothetical protein